MGCLAWVVGVIVGDGVEDMCFGKWSVEYWVWKRGCLCLDWDWVVFVGDNGGDDLIVLLYVEHELIEKGCSERAGRYRVYDSMVVVV